MYRVLLVREVDVRKARRVIKAEARAQNLVGELFIHLPVTQPKPSRISFWQLLHLAVQTESLRTLIS